jgi:Bacteriophage tail sheath protein
MPVQPTYPGVYIEEIPSGVRTITGVATSITAFIGRALRGPTDKAVTINSYGDFERLYGGLWIGSALGFAVRDFYLNGGSQAIIVRLFHPSFATKKDRDDEVALAVAAAKKVSDDAATEAAKGTATVATVAAAARTSADSFKTKTEGEKVAADLVAKAAEAEAARVDAPLPTPASVAAAASNAQAAAVTSAVPVTKALISDGVLSLEAVYEGAWGNALRARVDYDTKDPLTLFNLFVQDGMTGQIEVFRNLSITAGDPRQVDKVLENDSKLMRWSGALPASRPSKSKNPADPSKSVWADNVPATNSKVTSPASDGGFLILDDFTGAGKAANNQGLYMLQKVDIFNLLCIPPYKSPDGITAIDIDKELIDPAATFCKDHRAFLIIDPPSAWKDKDAAKTGVATDVGTPTNHAALFFPRLRQTNPLRDNQVEDFAPCGAVAGIFARTDTQRGVWKAPAGLEATLVGVPDLSVKLSDAENGELNPLGVDCLRILPAAGRVVWGARTREGDDRLTSEWKYVPVRRLALYIEESLFRGTQWVVFEPNDEPLWAQIRLNVGAFMQNLFRQGAFQGKTPREAYFVKCDKETTTQNDVDLGKVNIVVGFAPLKPAEFVIIQIQQIAGPIAT